MTNQELKLYEKLKRKKFRIQEKKFLIEGYNLIEECLNSDYYKTNLIKIILREDISNEKVIKNLKSTSVIPEVINLSKNKFDKLSDTENPQGIIGVVKIPADNIDYNKKTGSEKLIVVLDNVNDPGNLGTIIRNCYWFNADKLIIGKNSADVYNSKVIRSSQGAIFHINFKFEADIERELENLFNASFGIFVTDLHADTFSDEMNYKEYDKCVFVFGNESAGVSEKILGNKNFNKIKIKGYSGCESLNVAVSTGIILNDYKKSCPE